MRLLEERRDPPKHAPPVRCPQCQKSVSVLIFDSPAAGMVCADCHRRFMGLRQEAALVPKHRRAELVITTTPLQCAHCHDLAFVFVDARPVGLFCQHCHERMTPWCEEPGAGHANHPSTAIQEDLTPTARRAP